MRRATHKVNHSKFNIKIPAESSENKSKNELNNYTLFERRVIHLRRHKRELVLKIPTMAVVDIVYEITEEQEELIQCKLENLGSCSANRQLLKAVMRPDNGYVKLVKALEEIGDMHDLVEMLSSDKDGLSLMEEEETRPIHRFDKQVTLQHENFSSSPRAAIHREENKDTLDYERNKNNNNGDDDNYNDSDTYNADTLHYDTNEDMKMIYGNGNNNTSNSMSRKYVSNENQYKQKRKGKKGKNKVSPYKKVKEQTHVNNQFNINLSNCTLQMNVQTGSEKHISTINTQENKPTNEEIKTNFNASIPLGLRMPTALLGPAVGKVFSALGIIASIYFNNHNT
ncbi:uncharacterized protein [Apostichopus japonicus]|uniref:uncharacterized protein isoform X1 n=1 Tax=Stichopus japonicus TaxID=307972 RepID=UPI003AB3355A